MNTTPPWVTALLENPFVQLIAFVVTFVVRVEIDRWLRKRETKRQKKKRAAANG